MFLSSSWAGYHSFTVETRVHNLGITHKVANMMKQDMTTEEFFIWCKKILEFNGYKVDKI